MLLNNFSSGINFVDDTNYPYGFYDSGDFTLQESEILTNCGYIMQQLAKKAILPINEEQEHFVQVLENKVLALYKNEHVFLKYIKLTESRYTASNQNSWLKQNKPHIDQLLI